MLFRQSLIRGQYTIRNCSKMVLTLQNLVKGNNLIEQKYREIKAESDAVVKILLARRKAILIKENEELENQIKIAIEKLTAAEVRNGLLQVRTYCTNTAPPQPATVEPPAATANESKETGKQNLQQTKEKKVKKEKPAAQSAAVTPVAESPIDVGRLDLRVGKIIEVGRHPDADSLYLEKIDCGESQPRTVVSGLVKFIPLEEMQNRLVVVLCNLKPAKMRGVVSEAMVMCASTAEKVEVLNPPADAVPGDLVHCVGYTRQPDAQLNPKKKIFETCAPDLKTNDELIACYKGAALNVPGKGNIVAQTLKNVNVK